MLVAGRALDPFFKGPDIESFMYPKGPSLSAMPGTLRKVT